MCVVAWACSRPTRIERRGLNPQHLLMRLLTQPPLCLPTRAAARSLRAITNYQSLRCVVHSRTLFGRLLSDPQCVIHAFTGAASDARPNSMRTTKSCQNSKPRREISNKRRSISLARIDRPLRYACASFFIQLLMQSLFMAGLFLSLCGLLSVSLSLSLSPPRACTQRTHLTQPYSHCPSVRQNTARAYWRSYVWLSCFSIWECFIENARRFPRSRLRMLRSRNGNGDDGRCKSALRAAKLTFRQVFVHAREYWNSIRRKNTVWIYVRYYWCQALRQPEQLYKNYNGFFLS